VIRTIFFDYDGVLTTDKSGSATTFRYLSEASGMTLSTISAAFSPYASDLCTGRVSHAQIWRSVCEAMGEALDIGLLVGAFESTPLNKGMFSLAHRLSANYSVGIITDNNKDRMDHLRNHQGLDALFKPIVVSADVGSGKSGPEIFLHATSCAGVAPNESIFIDNSQANLAVARALGMHAVFHDDEKNDVDSLMEKLKSLGARIDDH
jgi:HAD superfamily hydrolase (TIGR01509 family)